jgi:sporulation protein YlmC with PRC-barrel domain
MAEITEEWLEKEEERLERLLKKALEEDEGEWYYVRKVGKVIVINEDELVMKPVRRAKKRKRRK